MQFRLKLWSGIIISANDFSRAHDGRGHLHGWEEIMIGPRLRDNFRELLRIILLRRRIQLHSPRGRGRGESGGDGGSGGDAVITTHVLLL